MPRLGPSNLKLGDTVPIEDLGIQKVKPCRNIVIYVIDGIGSVSAEGGADSVY